MREKKYKTRHEQNVTTKHKTKTRIEKRIEPMRERKKREHKILILVI